MTPAHGATARLLADVGGTNARFAWQAAPGAAITDQITLPCAEHASLADALGAIGLMVEDCTGDYSGVYESAF
jgi:glucokinase